MSVTTFNRKLYGSKDFSIKSFMHSPTVYPAKSGSIMITSSPVVFFGYDPKYEYGQERPKDASFKMNPRNQYKVIRFFEEILAWFEEPRFNDLFMQDETEGRILVNMDYRNLNALVRGSRFDAQIMLAIPAVITIDSIQAEGCALSINQSKYTIALMDSDIESILSILKNFSFQQETQLLLTIGSNQLYWSKESQGSSENTGSTPKVTF